MTRPDPTRADVQEAAHWLAGRVVRTPLLRAPDLDDLAGARLLVKAENLQTGGSYKMRGALRAVGRIAADGAHAGVVAQTTGNHGIAVALAAREFGLAPTVVLPVDAPAVKVAKIEAAGARVVRAGHTLAERLTAVDVVRAASGYAVVDAFDHRDVVAGQGSASLELIEDADQRGTPLDALVLPVGGGGGLAGAALAADGRDIAVYGVEPVGCDSLARSLAAGRRVTVTPGPTLADGLRPSCVGELPFRIMRNRVAGVLRTNDAEITAAFRRIVVHLRLVAEPSAAAALAGAVQLAAAGTHRTIGVVLTGGNIEPALIAALMAESRADVHTPRTLTAAKGSHA